MRKKDCFNVIEYIKKKIKLVLRIHKFLMKISLPMILVLLWEKEHHHFNCPMDSGINELLQLKWMLIKSVLC